MPSDHEMIEQCEHEIAMEILRQKVAAVKAETARLKLYTKNLIRKTQAKKRSNKEKEKFILDNFHFIPNPTQEQLEHIQKLKEKRQ